MIGREGYQPEYPENPEERKAQEPRKKHVDDFYSTVFENLMKENARLEKENQRAKRKLLYTEAQREQFEKMAKYDHLTGLLSRQAFEDIMQEMAKDHLAKGTLVVMDIDKFKSINDRRGHLFGDQVLKATAEKLKSLIRENTDLLARWGGDEFIAFLPETKPEEIMNRLKAKGSNRAEIRFAVADQIDPDNLDVETSLSVGAVEVGKDQDLNEAFAEADRLMYHNKHAQRNHK